MTRRGFSLIELMVACLLLGMLVTVLTMLFNTSSIAWRTGTAGVAELDVTRRQLGSFHDIRDEILPGVGDTGNASGGNRKIDNRTVSLWNPATGALRTDRAYAAVNWNNAVDFSLDDARKGSQKTVSGGQTAGGSLFTVGVRSAGPNGKFGDDDDITSWPNEVF